MASLHVIILSVLVIWAQGTSGQYGGSPNAKGNLPECSLAPDAGECKAEFIRIYFDAVTQECKTFNYGGCGGNPNRFTSFKACYTICGPHDATVTNAQVLSAKRYVVVPKAGTGAVAPAPAQLNSPLPAPSNVTVVTAPQPVRGIQVAAVRKEAPAWKHPAYPHYDVDRNGVVTPHTGTGPVAPAPAPQPVQQYAQQYPVQPAPQPVNAPKKIKVIKYTKRNRGTSGLMSSPMMGYNNPQSTFYSPYGNVV